MSEKKAKLLANLLQWVLNIALILLAIILICFLAKELFILVDSFFIENQVLSSYALIEGIVTYFLYFEFIALIMKYFQSGYHFPLRYFIYIGITAVIRLIIADHPSPVNTLFYSIAILVLIVALYVSNTHLVRRNDH